LKTKLFSTYCGADRLNKMCETMITISRYVIPCQHHPLSQESQCGWLVTQGQRPEAVPVVFEHLRLPLLGTPRSQLIRDCVVLILAHKGVHPQSTGDGGRKAIVKEIPVQ
jgi:hypothetical protein